MSGSKLHVTQEDLYKLFTYRIDGSLIYKTSGSRHLAGATAGYIRNPTGRYPRRHVSINYKIYLVHRLIYLYHWGWLPKQIDHINNNSIDNRIENLRKSCYYTNARNKTSAKGSSSKYLGVSWRPDRKHWKAIIWAEGQHLYLGSSKCEEKSASLYNKAAIKYYKEFANLNKKNGEIL